MNVYASSFARLAPSPPSPASPDSPDRSFVLHRNSAQDKPSSRRDQLQTPPSHAHRYFNHSSASSDDASDDGDDIPPTPGDLDSFRPIHRRPFVAQNPLINGTGRADWSKLFADGAGPNSAAVQPDGSLSLSPVANVFFPSFGDFLPAVKKQEEDNLTNGLGLSAWNQIPEAKTTSDKIDSLSRALARQLEIQHGGESNAKVDESHPSITSPLTGAGPFAPFSTFSPNTDSFTFCPSPDWKTSEQGHRNSEEATTTSASLRSPDPSAGLAAFPMRKSASAFANTLPNSHVVVTPPTTPVRNQPCRAAPPMQLSRSLPVPVAFSPSRSAFAPSPSPTRNTFNCTLRPSPGVASAYPLSPSDTERIAKLHNGRIPTLEQLCPEPAHPSAQPPIVNTGNQGVMVVQQGDWKCGTCSFVNWRRRKICLRCFPFANDIGNILTIQSQRAAHLATPLSAPAHQTTFLLASPTRSHFDSSSTGAMSRSTSFPPHVSPTRSLSPYPQPYLLAPIPHSASPTRSTFSLVPPQSPTRYTHVAPSTVHGHWSGPRFSEEHKFRATSAAVSSVSTALPSLCPASAGDLALRRAAKYQQPPPSDTVRRSSSIEPLNLANYAEQMSYAHAQQSTRTGFGACSPSRISANTTGGGYYQQRANIGGESPPSPTRYFHSAAAHHQRVGELSNGSMLNPPEL